MAKDKRYKTVKALINTGEIQQFSEIFEYIPVTTIAMFLGTNFVRLRKYIRNVKLFNIEEIIRLGEYFEVDPKQLTDLIYNQVAKDKSKRKGKA